MKLVTFILLLSSAAIYAQFNSHSLSFDGVNDFLTAGDPVNGSLDFDSSESFSLALWVKTTAALSPQSALITKRKMNGLVHDEGFTLGMTDTGTVYWGIEDKLYTYTQLTGNLAINDGSWHFVVVSRDVENLLVKIWIDGTADGSVTDNCSSGLENNVEFWIGRWLVYDRYFAGQLDEISVWSKPLSSIEISDLMTCPPSASSPDLISYWKFNEGSGTFSADSGNNANPAIINGSTWTIDNRSYPCTVGHQEHESNGIQLYPNPATSKIYLTGIINQSIVLSDIHGRTVWSGNIENNDFINVSAIPRGIYFLKVGDFVEYSVYKVFLE